MIRSFKTLLSLSLSLSLTSAVACSDDPDQTADFSNLGDDDRGFLVGLPVGVPLIGTFMVWIAEADSATGCPARSVEGPTITYQGDCTTAEGDQYIGDIIATNTSIDFFEGAPDPAAPSTIEFRAFELIQTDGEDNGQRVVLDGSFTTSLAEPAEGQSYTIDHDYSVAVTGPILADTLRVDARVDCDEAGRCTYRDGSAGELGSRGGFSIGGFYAFVDDGEGSQMTGRLSLVGLQELVIDFGAQGPECIVFEVDGAAAGTLCDEPEN